MNDPISEALDPLERQTLGERAFARISELLISGRLAPGEKLSIRQLAEALGVSMMPVREAVSRLAATGALEVTRARAVTVPEMAVSRFRDLTRVRIEIEGYAAAEAARQRDRAALEEIEAAEAAFRAESERAAPDLPRAVRLNQELHFAIYRAAGSPTLLELVTALWLKVGPVINLDLRENPDRLATGGAVRFHAEALEAIRAGDRVRARAAIAGDIASAAEFIISLGRLPD